jgi:hypothetical protein
MADSIAIHGSTMHDKLSTLRIGRCGELLVQYKLLKLGIESAPMTTDSGVDLVAFASKAQRTVTIQVKANDAAKQGGGRGKLALDWWIADDCPSELAACFDVSTDSAWLLTKVEVATMAQQHSGGRFHLYMYVDVAARPRGILPAMRSDCDAHLLERKALLLVEGLTSRDGT